MRSPDLNLQSTDSPLAFAGELSGSLSAVRIFDISGPEDVDPEYLHRVAETATTAPNALIVVTARLPGLTAATFRNQAATQQFLIDALFPKLFVSQVGAIAFVE